MAVLAVARQRPTKASGRSVAYDFIRAQIVKGTQEPGTLLSENELALELGLSRQPVREALMLIAQEGLVEIRPQSGTYVTLIDPDTVKQAQFIREAIEVTSLESCQMNFTLEDERGLHELLHPQAKDEAGGEFYPLEEAFHRRLLAIAGHENAWASVLSAKGHLDRARYLGLSGFRGVQEYVDDHRRIVEALSAGELVAAQEELRSHLRFVFRDVEKIMAAHPGYFTRHAIIRRSGRPARV